jgi:hypothetical protein
MRDSGRLATCRACGVTLVIRRFKWGLDWAALRSDRGIDGGDGITCPKSPGYLGHGHHQPGPYRPPAEAAQDDLPEPEAPAPGADPG